MRLRCLKKCLNECEHVVVFLGLLINNCVEAKWKANLLLNCLVIYGKVDALLLLLFATLFFLAKR